MLNIPKRRRTALTEGPGCYRASDTPRNVAADAVSQLIDRFCGGSVEELMPGLVIVRCSNRINCGNWLRRSPPVRRRRDDARLGAD